MDMDPLVITQEESLRWPEWELKLDKELMALTPLEIQLPLSEKVSQLVVLLWFHYLYMEVSFIMLDSSTLIRFHYQDQTYSLDYF